MRIAFIGLGTMGGRMANNVQKSGAELVVHDMHRQAAGNLINNGAIWAESPKAAAVQADAILMSLPGPVEVTAVCTGEDGVLAGMRPGTAVMDLTTNSPSTVRKLHAEFAAKGVHFLDCPVSGGPAGAGSGKLAIWVGGDKAVFEANRATLDRFADQVRYVGEIGAGSVAKLTHNCAGYVIQTALAEVFTMGVKGGVDPLALWEAVRQGALGRRRTFDGLVDQFLPGKFDPPAFALRLAHKDVTLATQLGRELGVPMRLANLVLEEMTEARNRGWDNRDSRSPMLLQEERAGVEIKVDPAAIRRVLDAS
ncbi:MAG: NAD(P)-dependent oxidoreductase [Acetobacteraceae bacterium]|nr:NAD(P)-dependent oxidoreductase [Acetobacteraceae bacterium]MSP30196.1 NAD(P)-dependent oxidoreductase [Acetobacteraceae bacterium]